MGKDKNQPLMRKPNGECTTEELAAKLLGLEQNVEFNFSANEDGSDYFGAKKMNLFDKEQIFVGYYGDAYLYIFDVGNVEVSDIVERLRPELNNTVYLFDNSK
jgi:hypothetical protein